MKIYLIGMPGSGKSTVGRPLAELLKVPFLDLDHIIEKKEELTIKEIFEKKGEAYFRSLEQEQLRVTTASFSDFILSTGGGTPCFFDNIHFMKENGKVVFLSIEIDPLVLRLQKEGLYKRPLLKEHATSESLRTYLFDTLAKRIPYFSKADIQVNSLKPANEIVEAINFELEIKP